MFCRTPMTVTSQTVKTDAHVDEDDDDLNDA